MTERQFWCYILYNTKEEYKNCTYVGYTVNPQRRIRQHNAEIKGGAKATKKGAGSWEFAALITGFETNNNALSCEWKLKHPDGKKRKNKKYCGFDVPAGHQRSAGRRGQPGRRVFRPACCSSIH